MNRLTLVLAIALANGASTLSADEFVARAFPEPASARGVVVLAGVRDVKAAVSLSQAAPVVVLAVAADPEGATRMKKELRAAGVLGQVTAATLGNGRIPLADHTASTVIADLDQISNLSREELRRVLRPFGILHWREKGTWRQKVIDRPADMDDWGHFHKDAASSEHSHDTTVGPARGLQWIAGPTIGQDYNLVMRDTVFTHHAGPDSQPGSRQLLARDAFSGAPLWIKKLQPHNRFCIVAEGDHVYVHFGSKGRINPHTVALDRRTGKQLLVYSEGLDFSVAEKDSKNWRAFSEQAQRGKDLQLRVVDGHLVQVLREAICILDATTGKKKWERRARDGYGFVHPVAGDGVLYIVEGEYTRHSSYTHWPMAKPDRIHALKLNTGESLWEFTWNAQRYGSAHAIYNLQLEGDRLAGAVTVRTQHKPQAHGLILDAKTGKEVYWGRQQKAWPGNTGAGHSHVRLHLRGDQAWTFEIGSPIARWDVGQPENVFSFKEAYKGNLRPVSCTVWRSTPNWWFGGVGCYPMIARGRGYFNASGRSNCDIGSFPANGLLYSPPNTCQCQPYLPGNKAYHSRKPRPARPLESRLVQGEAKAAKTLENSDNGWPQWQRDPARRAWQPHPYPTQLKQTWQFVSQSRPLPELLRTQCSSDAIIRGMVTQATADEGVVVAGIPDRHEVVALEPTTGQVRWRTAVDGRVDMAPSIDRGLVLVGTRNGFVYALNRDTGALVWRFLAAPVEDRILVNGQLESPWPVFGSIPVDQQGLIAVAGRHSDSDGGLWWWRLEPSTGEVLEHGRIGGDEPPAIAANFARKRPLDLPAAQNSVAVMTDRWFLLPGANISRVNGTLGRDGDGSQLSANSYATNEQIRDVQLREHFVLIGRNALIGERPVTVGGWRKPFYANTLARIFAINDTDCISVGGGPGTASGRGGGGDSKVHRLRLLKEPVKERRTGVRNVESLWVHDDRLLHSRGLPSVSALAVSANAVYLGMSIYGRDKAWRDAREEMAHRLRILNLEDGTLIRDVEVPARILQGGIALSNGQIYVATEDGRITAFGAP